jgi:hypothetical protein
MTSKPRYATHGGARLIGDFVNRAHFSNFSGFLTPNQNATNAATRYPNEAAHAISGTEGPTAAATALAAVAATAAARGTTETPRRVGDRDDDEWWEALFECVVGRSLCFAKLAITEK